MSSYLIIDTETLDEEAYAEFAPKVFEAVTASGGRFLVRGGNPDVIEGDWTPERIVVMAFDSDEGAGEFVRSVAYTSLQDLRARAVRAKVVAVEGYDG